jgi:DNA replication and repair protein RecF
VYVRVLSLSDFRCYESLDITFSPGANVLVGPNGQGKTNLVEAIGYLASQDSHRVASDTPLVRAGTDRAVIRAAVVQENREALLEIEINPGKANRARVNRSALSRPRDLVGIFRSVLFAPEDLSLVKGDPDGRRRFLDSLLVSRQPRYAGVRADYERVLKQRNTLLRTAAASRRAGPTADYRTLDVWDEHLAQHGAELLEGRLALVSVLAPVAAKAYDAVAPGAGSLELTYRHSLTAEGDADVSPGADRASLAAALLATLAEVRPQEIERGVTLAGPHRDDLVLNLGDLPAKGYASHGESWSIALALKLGSYELLRAEGSEPVLLLDDVFAELDTARRERLAQLTASAEQLIVTAAVPADIPAAFSGRRFDVLNGVVSGGE